MIHELRRYEIFEANKAAFHARFRDHATRIMTKYGFSFSGLWEASTPEGPRFVYLLEWPDEGTRQRAWDGFRADDEWKEIKRATAAAHGELVGDIETMVLEPTAYSPTPS